jgi:hypothetical protein
MKWLKRWKTQNLLLLAVIGPGFITANVDNDAGGIYTYSFAGAQFGSFNSVAWGTASFNDRAQRAPCIPLICTSFIGDLRSIKFLTIAKALCSRARP